MSQHGEYHLEGSKDQRIRARPIKREKKAFKYYIRKEEAMVWTHFESRIL